ncbi:MAG: hypothetical protein Q9180_003297, partial [Flavoplaca navasiana]
DENPPAKPPKKNDQSSEPAKKPDAATTTSDKKPTKAPESTKSSNTIVKPTSSVQTKSDKKKSPSSTEGSSQGLSQSSASSTLPSSIQPSNSNDPLIEATSEPQDDTLATPSASEVDSLAVTATDEALESVPVTPSANVLDTGSVIATSDLPDALSEAASASITDSPLSASQQPEDTEVQPVQTTEDEIAATALPASEDDNTIASAETLEDQSSLLDDPLAVTAEPQQTLEGEAKATDQSLIAETGDASSAIESPYLPTLTDVGTSPEPVETPLPTTLETSNSPVPPKASIECTLEPQDASVGEATDTDIVKRALPEITMQHVPSLGNSYVGFVETYEDVDCAQLLQKAREGYNKIIQLPGIFNNNIVVAALFIKEVGVVVASKPHSSLDVSAITVDRELRQLAQTHYPTYFNLVRNRYHVKPIDSLAVWHAEDLALLHGARKWERESGNPPTTFNWAAQIVAYGIYEKEDHPGPKPPCGSGYEKAGMMQPPCSKVLRDLEVTAYFKK